MTIRRFLAIPAAALMLGSFLTVSLPASQHDVKNVSFNASGLPSTSMKKSSVAAQAKLDEAKQQSPGLYEEASEYTNPSAAAAAINAQPTVLSDSLMKTETLSYKPSQAPTISGTLSGASEPRTVQLEQKNVNGLWSVVQTQTITPVDSTTPAPVSFPLSYLNATNIYRVSVLATDSSAYAVGGVKTVTIAQTPLTLKVTSVQTDLGNLPVMYGLYITSTAVTAGPNETIYLEQLDPATSAWNAINSTDAKSYGGASFYAPRVTTGQAAVTYRLHAASTNTDYSDFYTPTYTVSYAKQTTVITGSTLVNGKTVSYAGSTAVIISGTVNPAASRTALLQKYDAVTKTWVTVSTNPFLRYYSIPLPQSDAGLALWRVDIPADSVYTEATTGSTTIVRTASSASTALTSGSTRIVPWLANTLTWQVNAPVNSSVQIQQLHGTSTWVTMSTVKVNSSYKVSYSIPHGTTATHSTTIQFRLYIPKPAIGWVDTRSATTKVSWENPNGYTGVAHTVYQNFKAYCPTTLITISNSQMSGGEVWGLAHIGYNWVTIYGHVPAQYLQTVSLHECGHMRQWSFYGSTSATWGAFEGQMNKIYGQSGTIGMEQDADCIANAWHKNSYFGYKGNCVGAKGTVATMLAKGQKYSW